MRYFDVKNTLKVSAKSTFKASTFRIVRLWRAVTGGSGFSVLNSSGTPFATTTTVLNSTGTGYVVSGTVLNSSGSGFAVI